MTKIIEPVDFWKWAFSDFLSNTLRGVLAEYIVAKAMDCTEIQRTEWDAYDVITSDGIKIEVKSSAYLQSWHQEKISTIRFDIGQKKSWSAATNTSLQEATRSADVYVFCVYKALDKANANPLDLSQWSFLVCSSNFLNKTYMRQNSVSLSSLEKQNLRQISYDELCTSIRSSCPSRVI